MEDINTSLMCPSRWTRLFLFISLIIFNTSTSLAMGSSAEGNLVIPNSHTQKAPISLKNVFSQLNPYIFQIYSKDSAFCLAIKDSINSDDPNKILFAVNKLGAKFIQYHQTDKAIEVFLINLNIWKSIGGNDSNFLGDIYNNLGNSYFYKGEIDKAIEYFDYIELNLIEERSQDKLATNHLNLAYVYYAFGEYAKSLEYYDKAGKIYAKENPKKGIYCAIGAADVFNELNQKEKAKKLISKAYQDALEVDDPAIFFKCYLIMANVYNEEAPLKSKLYLDLAEIYFPQEFKDFNRIYLNRSKARLEVILGNTALALNILHQNLRLAKKMKMLYEQFTILKELADLYQYNKNYECALKYTKKLTVLQDSIAKVENLFRINKVKLTSEANQGRRKIEFLEQSNQEQNESLYWQRFTIMVLIGFVIGAILSLYYLIIGIKKAKQKSLLLLDQNKIISNQKSKLTEMNESRNKIISILSHDFRSPLNNIISLIDMTNEGFIDRSAQEFDDFLSNIRSTATQYRELLDTTLLWAKTQHNAFKVKQKEVDLTIFFIGLENNLSSLAKKKSIEIHTKELSNEIIAVCDPNILQVIILNLINNAIKFSPTESEINITIENKDEHIIIGVQDQGIGIPQKLQQHIFDSKHNTHRLGTNGETGSGFGLTICKELSAAMNSNLYFISAENKGSIFYLSIPAAKPASL